MLKKNISFMSENLNSNNIENDELNLKNEDSEYKYLLISKKISKQFNLIDLYFAQNKDYNYSLISLKTIQ